MSIKQIVLGGFLFAVSSSALANWINRTPYGVDTEGQCHNIAATQYPGLIYQCTQSGSDWVLSTWASGVDPTPCDEAAGEIWNQTTQSCEIPPPSCPDGMIDDGGGGCECPPGTEYLPDGDGMSCQIPPETEPDSCYGAIASGGGNGHYTVKSDGSKECFVGEPDTSACGIQDGAIGTGACFTPPTSCEGSECACESGYLFGTVNGSPVCVGSASSNNTGTSSPGSWGTSSSDSGVISETESTSIGTNAQGEQETTTITTTTTETTTTETTPNSNAAPFTCSDGRLAADLPSCDSAMSCDQGYYLVYGVCVPLPAKQTTSTEQETATTVTVTNNVTNQTTTTTTNSSTTNYGGGGAKQEDKTPGPSSMPGLTDNGDATFAGELQEVYTRIQNAPIVAAMGNVANIFPNEAGECPSLSMDLGQTIIGRNVETSLHCDIAETTRPVLGAAMLAFWIIVAFRTFASA